MRFLVQALPLLAVAGIAVHASCGDGGGTGDTTANVTVGDPIPEACNDGAPDGFCNAVGDVPESCLCFDCTDTAYCLGNCTDDNQCGSGEDCTCADCYTPGSNCVGNPNPDDDDDDDDDTTASVGGGGGGTAGAPPEGGAPANTASAATSGQGGAGGMGGM